MNTTANTNGNHQGALNAAGTAIAPSPSGQPVNRIRRKTGHRDTPSLIEHAEQLRTALRDMLVKANELLKAIKQERRQSRLVRSTLESLRQLKTIGV